MLPLSPTLGRIAVIGPNADTPYNQLGDYTAPQAREAICTVLDGVKAVVSNKTEVVYAKAVPYAIPLQLTFLQLYVPQRTLML